MFIESCLHKSRSSPGSAELSQQAATTLNLNYHLGAAIGSLKEVV